MNSTSATQQMQHTLSRGILAGLGGGAAEVTWVAVYAGITGGNAAASARGVTTAAGVSGLLPASPVGLGVAVHMMLAIGLGIVLGFAWQALRHLWPGLTNPYPFSLAALAGVWAMNFLVVLPAISPGFVHIVPFAVSLTSKLLFGVTAAAILQWQDQPKFLWRKVPGGKGIDVGR